MTRLLAHARGNAVAYLALFVALGGTSYAAFSLPAGSVGKRQIQRGAVDASKLDPNSVAASVRAWAIITWDGAWRVQSSSTDISVVSTSQGEVVRWRRTRFARTCMASVTPQRNFLPKAGGSFDGYVTTSLDGPSGFLQIDGLSVAGSNQVQDANILVICPSTGGRNAKA
jgi:hypothetical protein